MGQEKREPDNRMVHCVLGDYQDCPAKTPAACACNQMPKDLYEACYYQKYGRAGDD